MHRARVGQHRGHEIFTSLTLALGGDGSIEELQLKGEGATFTVAVADISKGWYCEGQEPGAYYLVCGYPRAARSRGVAPKADVTLPQSAWDPESEKFEARSLTVELRVPGGETDVLKRHLTKSSGTWRPLARAQESTRCVSDGSVSLGKEDVGGGGGAHRALCEKSAVFHHR